METADVPPRKGFDCVAYLKLFRFPLVFTAIADSSAGYLLTGPYRVELETLGLLAVTSAGLYFFGMSLNDIVDRRKDRQTAPGRVLPSGRLSLRAAQWAMILTVLMSMGAVLSMGYESLIQRLMLWGAIVASITAYNLVLKIPPVMGMVRACNLLLGVSARTSMDGDLVEPWVFAIVAFPTFLYISSLTYVSTLEDGEPSRVKVFLGAFLMALGALLAALALSILEAVDARSLATGAPDVHGIITHAMRHWHAMVFAALLTAWILRRAWEARDRRRVMLMVRDGVGGIILLDAALVASASSVIPALCVASLVIPAAVCVAVFKKLV